MEESSDERTIDGWSEDYAQLVCDMTITSIKEHEILVIVSQCAYSPSCREIDGIEGSTYSIQIERARAVTLTRLMRCFH